MSSVGIDTGGTFTDLACVRNRRLRIRKVPSTQGDPAKAVLAGLLSIDQTAASLVLATTVATNALLTQKGARAALLTTQGFEDLLELGRQAREELYNLSFEKSPPIIQRSLRIGVVERLNAAGKVLVPLRRAEVERVVSLVARKGIRSVAIGLLHAFQNPRHELMLERALRKAGCLVSRATAIHPLPGEYERFVLASANARVAPIVALHVRPLASLPLRLMLCDGMTAAPTDAVDQAIRTVLSGPAAGLLAAAAYRRGTRLTDLDGFATLDVGGTSADCGYLDWEAEHSLTAEIGPYPFVLPTLQVASVGAGGGSIARLDMGGALRVGPESAGADPGPACYGKSSEPTVTDAFAVLGYLQSAWFLGGDMPVDVSRSKKAIGSLAGQAGTSTREMARGIVRAATIQMASGIRRVTLAHGRDTARLALFVFGGAGGLFAAYLMEELGFPMAVVPPSPGTLSALGALFAPPGISMSESVSERLSAWPAARRQRRFQTMAKPLRERLLADGIALKRERLDLDLAYEGQSSVITLRSQASLSRLFERKHRERYGISQPGRPIRLVAMHAAVEGRPAIRRPPSPEYEAAPSGILRGKGGWPVRWRPDLPSGFSANGPLVIAERSSTTLVPAGFSVELGSLSCLYLRRRR